MERDQNNTHLDEIKLYQSVMKTMMLKVKSSDTPNDLRNKFQLIETVARSLQELFALGDISKDVDKMLTDNKGSHDVPPSKRVAREQGTSKRVAREQGSCNRVAREQGSMVVFVQTMGKRFTLDVKGSDTIQSMKAMIQNFPPSQQTLVYSGRALQDSDTLSECNIVDMSTLELILDKDLKIVIISPEGDHLADLTVRKWYTIWDVKTMIKSRTNTPQQWQKLEYLGRQFDDDFVTLAECDIAVGYKPTFIMSNSGQVGKVLHEIMLFINFLDSGPKYVRFYNIDYVINLKKMIEVQYGIPSVEQRLIFAGKQLEDSRTFEDYKLENGNKIDIVVRLRGS